MPHPNDPNSKAAVNDLASVLSTETIVSPNVAWNTASKPHSQRRPELCELGQISLGVRETLVDAQAAPKQGPIARSALGVEAGPPGPGVEVSSREGDSRFSGAERPD